MDAVSQEGAVSILRIFLHREIQPKLSQVFSLLDFPESGNLSGKWLVTASLFL